MRVFLFLSLSLVPGTLSWAPTAPRASLHSMGLVKKKPAKNTVLSSISDAVSSEGEIGVKVKTSGQAGNETHVKKFYTLLLH